MSATPTLDGIIWLGFRTGKTRLATMQVLREVYPLLGPDGKQQVEALAKEWGTPSPSEKPDQ